MPQIIVETPSNCKGIVRTSGWKLSISVTGRFVLPIHGTTACFPEQGNILMRIGVRQGRLHPQDSLLPMLAREV